MSARFWRRLALLHLGFILGTVAQMLYLAHAFTSHWDGYIFQRIIVTGMVGVCAMWFGIFMMRLADLR